MDNETPFSQCPVVSACVIPFSVFYLNLFLYYHYHYNYFIYLFFTRLWPSEIVFCWFHVWINFISASSLVASFCPGCSLFVVFFKFWTFGLSSRICDLFIRHSLWTTVALAGFSSRPRPVFPLGQPPLLGF